MQEPVSGPPFRSVGDLLFPEDEMAAQDIIQKNHQNRDCSFGVKTPDTEKRPVKSKAEQQRREKNFKQAGKNPGSDKKKEFPEQRKQTVSVRVKNKDPVGHIGKQNRCQPGNQITQGNGKRRCKRKYCIDDPVHSSGCRTEEQVGGSLVLENIFMKSFQKSSSFAVKSEELYHENGGKHRAFWKIGRVIMKVYCEEVEMWMEARKKELLDAIYLILFAAFFYDGFLHTTMFQLKDHTQLHLMMQIVLLVFVFVKSSLTEEKKIRQIIFPAAVLLFFLVAYTRRSRYEVLVTIALLVIGAQGISFRKIIQIYFVMGILLMVIMITASQVGWIENLVYHQAGRKERIAFGAVYPTDFGAHVFYLCLAWGYLRKYRIRFGELLVMASCGVMVYVFCEARMNAGGILLFVLLVGYCKTRMIFAEKKSTVYLMNIISRWVMAFSVPLSAFLFVWMTASYDENSVLWQKLNRMITGRLALGKKGIEEYGVSLFGQYIPMVGSGGTTEPRANYFFLDSSYVNILLCMGTVVFVIVCLLYIKISIRAVEIQDTIFLIVIFCLALQCVIEHHMLEVAYNPFTLAAFAKMQNLGRKEKEE